MQARNSSLAARGTIIRPSESQHRKININVGGETHSPYISTLKNVPDCPLAWIIRNEYQGDLDYDSESDVYFFDRHPGIFSNILNYFQTGKLHCPRDVCGPMFQEELNFWGIDETQMEACCWPNYTEHREIQKNLKYFRIARQQQINSTKKERKQSRDKPCDQSDNCNNHKINNQSQWQRCQQTVWEVLDEPYSSKLAKIYAYVSLGVIVLSVITYSLMTIEEIRYQKTSCDQHVRAQVSNSTHSSHTNNQTSTTGDCKEEKYAATILRGFEILYAVWFTMEILLRFLFCPKKGDFIKTISNWVDLIAVIPVYLLLILPALPGLMMLNMIRYVRIFRFFKLLYDLQILGKTLQAGMHQIFISFLILTVPTIIFSSLVYYTEHYLGSEKSKGDFREIQKGVWWSVVTMTTVGYGKVTPDSLPGKLLGSAASIVGIVIVSITASVIGASFQQYYNVAQTQLKIPAKTPTAFKQFPGTDTLLKRLRREDGKQASIQSDDSKDSGYGRSPLPTGDSDSGNSSSTRGNNDDNSPMTGTKLRERNVVVAIGKNEDEIKHLSPSAV